MDLGVQKHKVCNRNGAAIAVESVKGVNGKEATEAEKESLLGSEEKGAAAADKNKKRVARKVQWNDRKGSDLVEVLEFEPRSTLTLSILFFACRSICVHFQIFEASYLYSRRAISTRR